jgi:hypothetical protein
MSGSTHNTDGLDHSPPCVYDGINLFKAIRLTNADSPLGEAETAAVQQADIAVSSKPEWQYTATEWQQRALAAFTRKQFALADEYLKRALNGKLEAPQQGAWLKFNRAISARTHASL